MGSIAGALGAAVIMITLESLVDVFWNPNWSVVVFYAALILVLTFRPQGILGRKEARAQ
jgi:branched-chain amino acid transport system permease protein